MMGRKTGVERDSVVSLIDRQVTRLQELEDIVAEQAARIRELGAALGDMGSGACDWNRDYVLGDGGDCISNGVVPGCLRCQARRAAEALKEAGQ